MELLLVRGSEGEGVGKGGREMGEREGGRRQRGREGEGREKGGGVIGREGEGRRGNVVGCLPPIQVSLLICTHLYCNNVSHQ